MLTCTLCPNPAEPNTTPPLCPAHIDVVILADFIVNHGQPLNLANAQARLEQAIAGGGQWDITPTDLEQLLPGYLDYIAQAENINGHENGNGDANPASPRTA